MQPALNNWRFAHFCILLILVTGMTLSICWLLGISQPATAAPAVPGSISGVVRDVTGAPAGGIELHLYRNSSLSSVLQRTVSDANGAYQFGVLSPGLYRVMLLDQTGRYPSPQYYQDAVGLNDATDIVVAGAPVTGVDPVLHAGGQLRGHVTDGAGNPLANVEVRAYARGNSNRITQRAVTDSAGAYAVTALASGFYYLEYHDLAHRHYPLFYGNAERYYDSIPVGVSAGGAVDQLDIRLQRGGAIRGQVKNSAGEPLANITVQATVYYGYYTIATTTSDENGHYTLGPLAADTYMVRFSDPTQRYGEQFYNNAEFLTEAGVPVGAEQEVTGIDITLVKQGVAQGVVMSAAGVPLAGILVSASGEHSYARSPSTRTDTQGGYLLEGLSPDRYRVEFSNPEGLYLHEYYSDVTSLAAATWITAFPGEIITNVNASLALGGAITGVIKTLDGSALGDFFVQAIPQSELVTATRVIYTATTASHYTYTLGGLLPGAYLVRVFGAVTSEYYDDVTVDTWATPVQVTAGQFRRDINFVLGDGADAATISGTVRSPVGEPLAGVAVRLYCDSCTLLAEAVEGIPLPLRPQTMPPMATGGAGPWQPVRVVTTDSNGAYRLAGLGPRRYRLRFSPYTGSVAGNYAFAYYQDALDLASATDLVLLPRMQLGGIDATLAPGGTITGVITLDDGSPLRAGIVGLSFWDGYTWEEIGSVEIDALTGTYVRPFLQTGRYRAEVHGYLDQFFRYFYGNTAVFTEATDIAVTAGVTTPNINITLPSAGFFTAGLLGTVTAKGQPVAGIRVELYRYGDTAPVIYAITDAAGRYALRALSGGAYFVSFLDPTGVYAVAYNSGATTFADANQAAFELTSQQVISNVNAELEVGGAIRGRILDLLGKGVAQIEVEARVQVDDRWRQAAPLVRSDSEGGYTLPGLPPGVYRLAFFDPIGRYRSRYYGDVASIDASPDIEVTVGATTSDRNVIMATTVPALNRRVLLPLVAR